MNILTTQEDGLDIAPYKVKAIEALVDDNDYNIVISVWNGFKKTMVQFSILRSELNAASLKRNITKNGGIIPVKARDLKALVEMTEFQVNKMILSDDSCVWKSAHNNLGYIVRDGKVEFDGADVITEDGVNKSRYYGRFNIKSVGNFENIREMFNRLLETDSPALPLLMLGASATILSYSNKAWDTHIYNFVVHLLGTSSSGKSTVAKAIASFGGSPEGADGFFMSYLGTNNAIVKMVTSVHGVPIAIDEFSASGYRKDWSNFIYTLSNGYGKERCKAGGKDLEEQETFENVFVSTGEMSLSSKCSHLEGLQARLIEIDNDLEYSLGCSKFTQSAEESDYIKTVVSENYGILTPLIVKELFANSDTYNSRRKFWIQVCKEKYQKDSFILNISDRIFEYIAIIMVSAEVMQVVLKLTFDLNRFFDYYYFYFIERKAEDGNLWEKVYEVVQRMIFDNRKRLVYLNTKNGVPRLEDEQVGYEIDLSSYPDRDRHKDAEGNYCDFLFAFPISFVEKYFMERGYDDLKTKMKILKKQKLIKYGSSGCKYNLDVEGIPTPTYAFWFKCSHANDTEYIRREYGV